MLLLILAFCLYYSFLVVRDGNELLSLVENLSENEDVWEKRNSVSEVKAAHGAWMKSKKYFILGVDGERIETVDRSFLRLYSSFEVHSFTQYYTAKKQLEAEILLIVSENTVAFSQIC